MRRLTLSLVLALFFLFATLGLVVSGGRGQKAQPASLAAKRNEETTAKSSPRRRTTHLSSPPLGS